MRSCCRRGRCWRRSLAWSANQPPACIHYYTPERSSPLGVNITDVGVYPYARMPVVGLVRTQLLTVLVHRDRHRARAQGESMAKEGAQRPSGDSLHQRVARIVGAQTTGVEVGRARGNEWA